MRLFQVPAYLAAVLFAVTAVSDMATLAMPFNPGSIAWRFGTVGAASNYALTFYFGLALLCWTAAWFGNLRTLRVSAVVTGLAGVALLLLLGDFVMSALQLRGSVPQSELAAYQIGTVKASMKYLLFSVALLVTGVLAWRAASDRRAQA